MKVNVVLSRPRNPYGFAGIVLSYGTSKLTEVALNIEYRNLFEFRGVREVHYYIKCNNRPKKCVIAQSEVIRQD